MEKIWLSSPHMSGNEKKYVDAAFDNNWVAPVGENITEFENALKNYLGIPNVVALTTGTAALHLALINLGVDIYDEVIVSSFTFSASVNPILYQKATPVFVDCERDTWNMDPQLLEEAIKDRMNKGKKPKAIILVHVYGMPADIDAILNVANRYEIPVIEDAAESLGSKYKRQFVGTFGEMSILSFNGNKIITTSNGGALISHNKDYIEKSLYLATQARDNAPYYNHREIGYNYRLSNILAGIGRGQMEVLQDRIEKRRANFQFYFDHLNDNSDIQFLKENEDSYSNFWLTTCIISNKKFNRDDFMKKMEENNIGTRPVWKPMHIQSIFKDYPSYLNGVSFDLFNRGICLPSGSNLTQEQKFYIVNKIKEILYMK